MRETIARLLYKGLLLVALVACSADVASTPLSPKDPPESVEVAIADATGTEVKLSQTPDRIVCLHLSCIDILAELEREPAGMYGVLVEFAKSPVYFGEQANNLGKIRGRGEPNLEHLLALEPDVIVGHENQFAPQQRETLEAIAPVFLVGVENYQEAIANLKAIGTMLGEEEKAEAAAQRFLNKLAAYKAKSPQDRKIVVMRGTPSTFHVATDRSLVGATLSELTPYPWPLGDRAPTAINWANYSLEQILDVDPDVIFVVTNSRAPDFIAELKKNRFWQELKAVKSDRVYPIEESLVGGMTTGTRSLTQLLDVTMPKVYPNVFSEPVP